MRMIKKTYISGYLKDKPKFDMNTAEGFQAKEAWLADNWKFFGLAGYWSPSALQKFAERRKLNHNVGWEFKTHYID